MEECRQPRPARLLARGDDDARRNPVGREAAASCRRSPRDAPQPARPRALADRPAASAHRACRGQPVSGSMFFGRGSSPRRELRPAGGLPSHPELLDWLARDFVDRGWDVKALVQIIVLVGDLPRRRSRAASATADAIPTTCCWPAARGSGCRPRCCRHGALAQRAAGGRRSAVRAVKPYQPEARGAGQQHLPARSTSHDTGDGLYRRSLYTFWRRTSPPPNMLMFDVADPRSLRRPAAGHRARRCSRWCCSTIRSSSRRPGAGRAARPLVSPRPGGATPWAFRPLIGRTPDTREGEILAQASTSAAVSEADAKAADEPARRGARTAGCRSPLPMSRRGHRGEPDHQPRRVRRDDEDAA